MRIAGISIIVILYTLCLSNSQRLTLDDEDKYNFDMNEPQDRRARRALDRYIRKIRSQSFGVPSTIVGDRVARWTPDSDVNPENLGDYLQGDILIPRRRAPLPHNYVWPGGNIYYKINGTFRRAEVRRIMRAMKHITRRTKCIRFFPYNGEQPDYVSIESNYTGCWSALGRVGGKQQLNLQAPGCVLRRKTPIHELCHAVGLPHEQCRENRDKYVKIIYSNIPQVYQHNFDKDPDYITKVKYSYRSIMHYPAKAFSSNGKKTIKAKKFAPFMGKGRRLNKRDVRKIRAFYNCVGSQANV